MKKHIYILFFIFCCSLTNLSAQEKVHIENNYGSINDNKKEIAELTKSVKQLQYTLDEMQLENQRKRAKIDSIYNNNIMQKDSAYQALNSKWDREYLTLKDSIGYKNQRIAQLESIIQIQNSTRFRYLPVVHQVVTKQTGKAIFFATTEIGLLGTGIGYCVSAHNNLNKHKDNRYDQWERDRFYDKYENRLCTSGWLFAGAGLMVALNYCDNFNWFRKNNIKLASVPMFDWQGNPQMTMVVNVKF